MRRSIETSTSGGSSDTDMKALAVMPWTCSPLSVVTTVTPVANIPSVRRSATAGSSPLDVRPLGLGDLVERALPDPVRARPAEGEVELGGRAGVAHERGRVLSGS